MTKSKPQTDRETDGLKALGATTAYPTDYTSAILEVFDNRHPERDYWTLLECLEFTSLCPITSQPDWATVYIRYIADAKMIESKSLKLYLHGFRNRGDFHEDVINIILNDLVAVMQPRYIEVLGIFHPRGGIAIHPFANWGSPLPRRDSVGERWTDFARQRRDGLTLSEQLGTGRHLR
jgi:7-cyano-7-deazaguanine reductase